jgi:uncharacterized coiled-coil protein SlyX
MLRDQKIDALEQCRSIQEDRIEILSVSVAELSKSLDIVNAQLKELSDRYRLRSSENITLKAMLGEIDAK